MGRNAKPKGIGKPESHRGYWTHRYKVGREHTNKKCTNKAEGHKDEATWENTLGGNTTGKPMIPNSAK